ncbi:Cytosine/adenosine deaminase [Carnobacterium alterfunditum]|uniref:Cytosine/adenosine deaminase n=1 Tax=Carnobacterium alterfunditum TaxID=28230 RepID=A0A1N6EKF9_9LACT|nr:amidohydrolase [Carnobacterium alterfunditum]SIN83455.1 Cytosine/adenosine deaminase [Carnobacterium alterfunditum]
MKTLIKNSHILTMDEKRTEYSEGYLIIEDRIILEIGSYDQLIQKEIDFDEVIDGHHTITIPGMINTHTHIGMIPFRSLGDDCPDRLHRVLFPLEIACMTKELAYHSGKYAIAEMQLAGITTFTDMYYFEDALAQATDEMKSRAILGETVVDFPTCDTPIAHGGIDYAKKFIPKWLNHELITPAIAPHAPNTNDPESLKAAAALAEEYGVPMTMHIAEMDYEMNHFSEKYNATPIAFLQSIGVLSPRLIAAHCIHLSDQDLQILKKEGVGVAHCIGANTKSAKGIARIKDMLELSIPVGLGTDGPSSGNTLDLFTQMKLVANFHKTNLHDRSIFPAKEIVAMATIEGAKVLNMANQIGSLEVGKRADIVLVETTSVNMFPIFDAYAALVYSANASNVQDAFINGTSVVRNKKLVNNDLSALRSNLAAEMTFFSKKAKELT